MDEATQNNAAIIQYVIILGALSVGLLGLSRVQLMARVKMFLAWMAIIIALVAATVYWEDFTQSRLYASIVPGSAVKRADGGMEFVKANDGHFHILARINGKEVRFLLDTGASDIVLTQKDAENAGIDVENLNFNRYYATANGTTRGANVTLGVLEIGEMKSFDVPASVNEGQMDKSLLGMSFLGRLHSFRIEGDKLVLYK